MKRIFRILATTLALSAGVAALPAVASADPQYGRDEHGTVDRARHDWERTRWERWEREQAERARIEHERACGHAWQSGASAWQLREMGCWVR
jgi:hypothetical protein